MKRWLRWTIPLVAVAVLGGFVARALIAAGEIKLHRAQEILARMVRERPSAEAT